MTADAATSATTDVPVAPAQGRGLRVTLVVVLALAALVIAGTVGWLVRGGGGASNPSASSVDAGFARDMTTHHIQAVTMAGIERDGTTDPRLESLSYDIETSQQFQVGQMSGWLDDWHLSRNSAHPMSWMGHDHMAIGAGGLMPGMATGAQMTQLVHAKGKARDILFLQLMIHHHQGGIPMARYAREHATQQYVRSLAQSMINAQSTEVIEMEKLVRQLGGQPLPPPT